MNTPKPKPKSMADVFKEIKEKRKIAQAKKKVPSRKLFHERVPK